MLLKDALGVLVRIQLGAYVIYEVSTCVDLPKKLVHMYHCKQTPLDYAVKKMGIQFTPPDELHSEHTLADAFLYLFA